MEKDGFGSKFEMLVADNPQAKVIGFIAWIETYDLHHCLKGGEIIDFTLLWPIADAAPVFSWRLNWQGKSISAAARFSKAALWKAEPSAVFITASQ